MLKNEYLIAKFGLDTAENGPVKECCVCGEAFGAEVQAADISLMGGPAKNRVERTSRGTLSEARSRLYQGQIWQSNTHFSAFFKI